MTEIRDYVLELAPQNKFQNLTGILEKIAGETHKAIDIHKLDESQWISFLAENKEGFSRTYGHEDLNELEEHRDDVNWMQNSNFIQITLPISKDSIDTINEERIYTSLLKGEWWGKVSKIDITDISQSEENPLVQIEFDVDCKWPTLIKYGNPDALSCFYIALMALEKSQFQVFEEYVCHSAMLGCYTAQKTWALVLLDQEKYAASVHWLSRCALMYNDKVCSYVLARRLLAGEGIDENAPLAEFLLCRLCIQNFTDAFLALGKLYLFGQKGVRPMKAKAKFLLEKFIGDCIEEEDKDRDEAIKLLSEEDFTPLPDEDQMNNNDDDDNGEEGEDQDGTNEEGRPKISTVDWALAGGVVAAAGAAGLFAFKRFFRHGH